MNIFRILTSNYIINVGVTAWLAAQLLKTLFTLVFTKKFVPERMVGSGGMPSSHSALVSSIMIAMQIKLGFASPVFGLSFAFAAVVMYDAMGVRRAAGEQAKVLNRIMLEFTSLPFFPKTHNGEEKHDDDVDGDDADDLSYDTEQGDSVPIVSKKLKEFLGHTPLEVLGGCLVGILVAVFMPVV